MNIQAVGLTVIAIISQGFVIASANQPRFEFLHPDAERATNVSGDGATIVGTFEIQDDTVAFNWTPGQFKVIGGPNNRFEAVDVSRDGSITVGSRIFGSGSRQAFRFGQDGLVDLLPFTRGNHSLVRAISGDGSTVVGNANEFVNGNLGQAVVWRDDAVRPERLFWADGDPLLANVYAISQDASVMAGIFSRRMFIWREGVGAIDMGTPRDGAINFVSDLTSDGSVAIGLLPPIWEGWIWIDGDYETLDAPDGFDGGIPTGISDDHRRIVGLAPTQTFFEQAIIWEDRVPMVLDEYPALDIPDGWQLISATEISNDGSTIVGEAFNLSLNQTRAYRVLLPPVPAPATLAVLFAAGLGRRRR